MVARCDNVTNKAFFCRTFSLGKYHVWNTAAKKNVVFFLNCCDAYVTFVTVARL